MRYYSTAHTTRGVTLDRAIRQSIAPDGGIYLPESVPVLPQAFLNNMAEMTLSEIAYVVADMVLRDELDSRSVKAIVDDTLTFDIPLVRVTDGIYVCELFHGPTLTYKDLGAGFSARLLRHFMHKGEKLNILVSTTSNTGAAVANSFKGMDGVNVFVMYPHGIMTPAQEAQITIDAPNIYPIEVQGSIDDCQNMMRAALADPELNSRAQVISMNSVNVVRLLPQMFTFFHIYARMAALDIAPSDYDVAIPCGNLSNLTSAVLSRRMGLPVGHIIAGCNTYSTFCDDLTGAASAHRPHTCSRAMDTLHPYNAGRLVELYGGDTGRLHADIKRCVIDDNTTASTINEVLDSHGYLLDPHSAVAYAAGRHMSSARNLVVLATSHPAKSLNIVTDITGKAVDMPLQLNRFMARHRHKHKIAPAYPALRKFLITHQ